MSIQDLLELRMMRQKPESMITVFIGKRPKWKPDGPTIVVVSPTDRPAVLDWRPLIGLWVCVVMAGDDYALAGQVLDALKESGAKVFGAAYPCGTYPCIADPTKEHHRVLRETRELLCQS